MPLIKNPAGRTQDAVLLQFNRFGVYHNGYGAWYPIRCAMDGRWKLAINLHDSDELYDLTNDPGETTNLIADPGAMTDRDRLHDWILSEMNRTQDPLRGSQWANVRGVTLAGPHFYGVRTAITPTAGEVFHRTNNPDY